MLVRNARLVVCRIGEVEAPRKPCGCPWVMSYIRSFCACEQAFVLLVLCYGKPSHVQLCGMAAWAFYLVLGP